MAEFTDNILTEYDQLRAARPVVPNHVQYPVLKHFRNSMFAQNMDNLMWCIREHAELTRPRLVITRGGAEVR